MGCVMSCIRHPQDWSPGRAHYIPSLWCVGDGLELSYYGSIHITTLALTTHDSINQEQTWHLGTPDMAYYEHVITLYRWVY